MAALDRGAKRAAARRLGDCVGLGVREACMANLVTVLVRLELEIIALPPTPYTACCLSFLRKFFLNSLQVPKNSASVAPDVDLSYLRFASSIPQA